MIKSQCEVDRRTGRYARTVAGLALAALLGGCGAQTGAVADSPFIMEGVVSSKPSQPQWCRTRATLLASHAACASAERPPSAAQERLIHGLAASGATNVQGRGAVDGGTRVVAQLNGRPFALAAPANWNRQALLFAGGYTMPDSSTKIPDDPVGKDPAFGLLSRAYGQGYAVGYIAYDKPGIGVESGVHNIVALRRLLGEIGATRVYISGGSMGGNVVMGAIDTAPDEFAGALSACGVVDGWETLIGGIVDLRAAYVYFTKDTPYALPGRQDVGSSGLSTRPPRGLDFVGDYYRMWQLQRVMRPVDKLFKAANANPDGAEARIIRNIASVSGAYEPEVLSFAIPLADGVLGMDDIKASFGGLPYGNAQRVYRSAYLDAAENAALNARVQRLSADAAAVERARAWHQSTGRSPVRLITMHNQVDALVPAAQQAALVQRMAAAGNSANVVAYTLPTTLVTIPGVNIRGITHCGFSPDQVGRAWDGLTRWVETGRRP